MRIHDQETHLKSAVIGYLKATGVEVWNNPTGLARFQNKDGDDRVVPYGKVGSSDIFGVLPEDGRFLCVETKIHPNKPTHYQWRWMLQMQRAKAVALWINSIEELMLVMPRIRKGAWIKTVDGSLYLADLAGDYNTANEPNPVAMPIPKPHRAIPHTRSKRTR